MSDLRRLRHRFRQAIFKSSRFKVPSSKFWVKSSEFRVQSSVFRAWMIPNIEPGTRNPEQLFYIFHILLAEKTFFQGRVEINFSEDNNGSAIGFVGRDDLVYSRNRTVVHLFYSGSIFCSHQ